VKVVFLNQWGKRVKIKASDNKRIGDQIKIEKL